MVLGFVFCGWGEVKITVRNKAQQESENFFEKSGTHTVRTTRFDYIKPIKYIFDGLGNISKMSRFGGGNRQRLIGKRNNCLACLPFERLFQHIHCSEKVQVCFEMFSQALIVVCFPK